ncbi:GntR family transcriptional regulator [Nonomuraea jabiensis]|uniref:GntR family transcriptional regulator n=1 Tax=Nonomuraea jabiensis TaxID=882448 RepID=UPI00341CFC4F
MIKREAGRAFWKTIYDELKRRIETGVYTTDTPLIATRLAQEFDTTRITVNKALAALRREGVIETEVGVGSRIVARPPDAD